jgi:hypothetical protein
MKRFRSSLVATAFLSTLSLAAFAQTGPGVYDPNHPRVNQDNRRNAREQRRIHQGANSGRLTQSQAARLQNGQQRIQNQEQRDLAKNNGHLTAREQQQINREQNRLNQRTAHDERRNR